MDDPSKLIALARIAGEPVSKDSYRITVAGDGLRDIKPPINCWIYLPADGGKIASTMLDPARKGLLTDGELRPARLKSRKVTGNKGMVVVEPQSGGPLDAGMWICIEKRLLEATQGIYLYQIIGIPVYCAGIDRGVIKDYFETGAHGVLVVKASDGHEIMVPYVDEFVRVDLANQRAEIEALDDFDVV